MLPSILSDIAEKLKLKRGQGRWYGACPECGGSSHSDKFDLRDDGGYKCHACQQVHGDVIDLLKKYGEMSCPEAYIAAGRTSCTLLTCPGRERCRLGNGSGDRTPRRREPLQPRQQVERSLPVTSVSMPGALWLSWAGPLVAKAQPELQAQPEQLACLAARGVNAEAVRRFRLGWLGHDRQVDKRLLGLPVEDGKRLQWYPGGLLIPIYDRRGMLHRLRARRTPEARQRFLPDLKYSWYKGSGDGPLVIRPAAGVAIRGAVIIEAELCSFACAVAHPEVMIIGLGTVGAGLPARLQSELESIPTILLALDLPTPEQEAEAAAQGKQRAERQAVDNWQRRFRQARYWPVPAGKDPGDYVKDHGGDLAAWIEAGLVPKPGALRRQTAHPQDLPSLPLCPQPGGQGEEIPSLSQVSKEQEITITADAVDPYLARIEALEEPVRSDARALHAMMEGHPIMPWLSADGLDCGILASGDWKQRYRELASRFSKLFYGPAHAAVCTIYRERFIATGKLHGKGGSDG